MTQTAAMTRMQKLRAKMMIQHPFFAAMLVRMPMVERTDIPTAATDMESIFINPAFIDSLPDDDVATFVIAHELSHRMFLHGIRLNERNHDRWNRACDYAINWMLKESKFTIWEHALLDEQYADMSADQIYRLLEEQGEGKSAGGDAGGMIGDILAPPGGLSPEQEAKIRRKVQQSVAQAAQVARMAGKVPGGLQRFIDDILDPKVPWQTVLREYMTRVSHDTETWSRRNRRFEDVFLPTRYSYRMGGVVIINDTSGSIGGSELVQFNTEGYTIIEDMRPEWVRILWADTQVASEQLFEDGDPFTPKAAGGGGTDMRVPLKHAEQYQPEVCILFTDGYTPWPEGDPPYPLIVCCTTNADVPVGQVIRI